MAADKDMKSPLARVKEEYSAIEYREDISDGQKVTRVIKITASVCAAVAVQPIPFADIFVLTPIQIYMGERIAAVRGVPVTKGDIKSTLAEISGAVGLGLLAQQAAIGAYKTGLPFLGGFMTIPLVWGLTYGIGRVMDEYFKSKAKGQRLTSEQIRDIWKKGRREGKRSVDGESTKAHVKYLREERDD